MNAYDISEDFAKKFHKPTDITKLHFMKWSHNIKLKMNLFLQLLTITKQVAKTSGVVLSKQGSYFRLLSEY